MFQKIPGNVPEDSGECSGRFWGTLIKATFYFDLAFLYLMKQ